LGKAPYPIKISPIDIRWTIQSSIKKLKAAGFAQPRLHHHINNAPKPETVEQLEKFRQSVEAENFTRYCSLEIAIEISSKFLTAIQELHKPFSGVHKIFINRHQMNHPFNSVTHVLFS
jgi:hypothetical protein